MVFIRQLLLVFVSPWVLLLVGTMLAVYFFPSEWVPKPEGVRLAEGIEAYLGGRSQADVATLIGRAEGGALTCDYRFDIRVADAVLSHFDAGYAEVMPRGRLYSYWSRGFRASVPGYQSDPVEFCGTLVELGLLER